MPRRSRYFELMEEEGTLVRSGRGTFSSVDELRHKLQSRAAFAEKIEAALRAGEITHRQYDALTLLNRQHALGMVPAPPFPPAAAASASPGATPMSAVAHSAKAALQTAFRWIGNIRFGW